MSENVTSVFVDVVIRQALILPLFTAMTIVTMPKFLFADKVVAGEGRSAKDGQLNKK